MSLIPLKKEQYMRLHADLLAKSDKRRLARRPERTEYPQTKAQGHALTYAFWVDRKFRDFLEKNPTHETCSKLHGAAWDLVAFPEENTADFWGEDPGIQGRWGASFH